MQLRNIKEFLIIRYHERVFSSSSEYHLILRIANECTNYPAMI